MEHFAVGTVSFAFAVLFPVLYFVGLQVRRLGAWSKRAESPKDRVGFFLLVAAIFGFAVGCFAQPQWDKANECKAQGQPVISCMFFPK